MKKQTLFLSILLFSFSCLLFNSCSIKEVHNDSNFIKVAVFKGLGADPECLSDAVEAIKIDKDIKYDIITASDIIKNRLQKFDVLLFPGGGGSRQMSNIGDLGKDKIIKFVLEDGKGIVGICAGAYMLSDTPDYTCFNLNPYEAIDRIHDERGHGLIEFKLTEDGKKIFPELADQEKLFSQYYEGPVLIPNSKNKNKSLNLGVMISDVHLENDAPANMTNDKSIFVAAEAGKGKVFSSVVHPENTPGMRWIIPRAVRWVSDKELVEYPKSVVRPERYSKERLFSSDLRKIEYEYFTNIIYGSEAEKIEAIKELVKMRSWGAKERITGLLRDKSSSVRIESAKALVDLEHTAAISDLENAFRFESDNKIKSSLKGYFEQLAEMCNYNVQR